MDETQSVYPGMRYDLRLGWVSVGPGEPEEGIRQPTLWGFTQPDAEGPIPSCDRPGHKYSYCDCGPYAFDDEVPDQDGPHGDTCDCADCDGGGWIDHGDSWEDDGVDLYDPAHPGVLNDNINYDRESGDSG